MILWSTPVTMHGGLPAYPVIKGIQPSFHHTTASMHGASRIVLAYLNFHPLHDRITAPFGGRQPHAVLQKPLVCFQSEVACSGIRGKGSPRRFGERCLGGGGSHMPDQARLRRDRRPPMEPTGVRRAAQAKHGGFIPLPIGAVGDMTDIGCPHQVRPIGGESLDLWSLEAVTIVIEDA